MFCENCGNKLVDGAKFCSACGHPVLRDDEPPLSIEEENRSVQTASADAADTGGEPLVSPEDTASSEPAVPKESADVEASAPVPGEPLHVVSAVPKATDAGVPPAPILTGKKSRGLALVVAGAAVLVVAALVFALIKFLPSFGDSAVYLYATDDGEIHFLSNLKEGTKSVELTDEGGDSVYFSPDGKYIYYFEQDLEEYSAVADLYRAAVSDLTREDFQTERVSPDVQKYSLQLLRDERLLYLKGESPNADLYCYDGEENIRLARDVYDFSFNEEEKWIYYSEYDQVDYTRSVYRLALDGNASAEKLLDSISIIYNDFNDEVLVYGEETGYDEENWNTYYDVYSIKPGESARRLAQNVCAVYNVHTENGEVSFAFLTAEKKTHALYEYVTDSLAAADSGVTEPDSNDYISGYDSWGWEVYDWDAYYSARDAWYAVEDRNYIREYLKNNSYTYVEYALHKFESGEDVVLAEGLASYPSSHSAADIFIYQKPDQWVDALVDVSTLAYPEEIYDYLENFYTYEPVVTLYQCINGVESELDLGGWDGLNSIDLITDREVILSAYGAEGSALLRFTLENNAMTFDDVLAEEFYWPDWIEEDGAHVLYYFTDFDSERTSGDLVRYVDGESEVVAKDAKEVYILEDGTVFKLEDIAYDVLTTGSLYTVVDGKDKRIADDVVTNATVYLSPSQVLYISEGDLYVWEGEESRRLAKDVSAVWASNALERRGFYLY